MGTEEKEFVDTFGVPYRSMLVRHQTGKGPITDWFRGVYNYIKPYLTRGATAASKELLSTGSTLLGELSARKDGGQSGESTRDIVKRNLKEGGRRALKSALGAMQGNGRKRGKKRVKRCIKRKQKGGSRARKRQSSSNARRGRVKITRKKNNSKKKIVATRRRRISFQPDIFG